MADSPGLLTLKKFQSVIMLTAAVKFNLIIIILNFTSVCESLAKILIIPAFPNPGLNKLLKINDVFSPRFEPLLWESRKKYLAQ